MKKEHHLPDPLITEQFLISKGWRKQTKCFVLGEHELKFKDKDGWRTDKTSEAVTISITSFEESDFYGAIPTESQYEVLNKLLKLHEPS